MAVSLYEVGVYRLLDFSPIDKLHGSNWEFSLNFRFFNKKAKLHDQEKNI